MGRRASRFGARSYVAGPPPQTPTVSGDVRFAASPDHATLTSYEVRVRPEGSGTVAGSENVGKPTPDAYGDITVNMSTLFGTLSAGNYTVSVAAVSAGGTTDSDVSAVFALPLT